MNGLIVNEHYRKQKDIYKLGKDEKNIHQYILQ